MKNLFYIYGSCISRDGFEFINKDTVFPERYTARYSMARLTYPPARKDYNISKLTSNFQKNILKRELNNNLIIDMDNNPTDYIILDFIDDRFGLIELEKEVFVTNSLELRNSGILEDSVTTKSIIATSDDFFNSWCQGVDIFFYEMRKRKRVEKIIVNAAFWSYNLEDGRIIGEIPSKSLLSVDYINLYNDLLNKQYNYLRGMLEPYQFIEYPAELFRASLNHKWGISCFHYIDEFYEFFMNFIEKYSENFN